jgi:hypothetical protein
MILRLKGGGGNFTKEWKNSLSFPLISLKTMDIMIRKMKIIGKYVF